MREWSLAQARSVAQAVGSRPHRLNIGLKPLGERPWVEDQWDFADQLRERQHLIDTHDDVVVAEQPDHEAIVELRDLLLKELPRDLPTHYRAGDRRPWIAPLARPWPSDASASALEQIARVVPDDLCLMRRDEAGTFRLIAAAVCFPTRWGLLEKMGHGLDAIHAPVPQYKRRIGLGVAQVFEALRPERTLGRVNWSLTDSPTLYQPARLAGGLRLAVDDEDIGQSLWLRTERQTIRALARSEVVVFTIRIRQLRLAEACAVDSGLAVRLRSQLDSMDAGLREYKGLGRIGGRIGAWLDRQVCAQTAEVSVQAP